MNNPDLKNAVETLIAEVESTHRYSMSRIYNLYNEVYEKSETPQSCASCLIKKVKELKSWLESSPKEEDTIQESVSEVAVSVQKKETGTKKRRKNGSS